MTYDLLTARGKRRFGANNTGMSFLCAAIVESGVNLRPGRICKFDPKTGAKPVRGNLLTCFATNSGFHVTPRECAEIADRIEAALPRWMKHPKVIAAKEVLKIEVPGRPKGAPRQWRTYELTDPLEWDRRIEAAEIGAKPGRVALAWRFVQFCREACYLGGFYVY